MGVPDFQRTFEAGDIDGAVAQFAPVFAFYHTADPSPATDHEILRKLLRDGRESFGEGFRFLDHLEGDVFHAAPWTTRINEHTLDGVDLFKVDDQDRIVEFRVLMRPFAAIAEWMGTMRQISGMPAPPGAGPPPARDD